MRNSLRQQDRRYRDDDELRSFKTDIDLREFAKKSGYRQTQNSGINGYWRGELGPRDEIIIKYKNGVWVYVDPRAIAPKTGKKSEGAESAKTQASVAKPGEPPSARPVGGWGTIIDLIQRVRPELSDLGEIRRELRSYAGTLPPRGDSPPPPPSKQIPRAEIAADIYRSRCGGPSHYLAQRGLRPDTLRDPRFARTFGVRPWGEVIFPHRDSEGFTGYERKSLGRTLFSAGGTRTLWCSHASRDDQQLIIAESAIDCFSYHQLNRPSDARYLSTAGAPSALQLELIASAITRIPPGGTLVVATDNDDTGRKFAGVLSEIAEKANPAARVACPLPPIGKDWNDTVKEHESAYIQRNVRSASCRPG